MAEVASQSSAVQAILSKQLQARRNSARQYQGSTKRERLAEADIALPRWIILVGVVFAREDVRAKLVAAGLPQNSREFFTRLGVMPYLTEDAIGRTLDYKSSMQSPEVVFDDMEPPEASS